MINKRMIRKKRGLSPVIATVLLIGIVIVMALIVFIWIKGINEEAIKKFDGENVEITCERVKFDASYSFSGTQIANRGDIPIYQMKAKLSGAGSYETIKIKDNWPDNGLLVGDAIKLNIDTTGYTEALLIPVLAGKNSEGVKTYTCDERFGKELVL